MLEKSSTSYLGSGCCEFESRHSGQNPQELLLGVYSLHKYISMHYIKFISHRL